VVGTEDVADHIATVIINVATTIITIMTAAINFIGYEL